MALLLVLTTSSFAAKELIKCKIDDNDCLLKLGNQIVLEKFLGDDKLSLLSLDPLKIDKMDIAQNGGNVSVQMDLKFRRAELLGISKSKVYKISGFKEDPDKNILEVHFKMPLGTLVGKYDINGKMLILPINGRGNITLNLENLDVKLRFLAKKIVKNGKNYMLLDKAKFSYDVTG